MLPKPKEHEHAIALRKQGYSYGEIQQVVPVSQASLSLWLRHIPISEEKQQENMMRGRILGGQTRNRQRLEQLERLKKEVKKELPALLLDPFFVLGVALYWAEGSKQKPWNLKEGVSFANSDERTLALMEKWFRRYLKIDKNQLTYRLHIHESADIEMAKEKWSQILNVPVTGFRVTIKRNNSLFRKNTYRNTLSGYKGLVVIRVNKSTWFNRRIELWTVGMSQYFLAR